MRKVPVRVYVYVCVCVVDQALDVGNGDSIQNGGLGDQE